MDNGEQLLDGPQFKRAKLDDDATAAHAGNVAGLVSGDAPPPPPAPLMTQNDGSNKLDAAPTALPLIGGAAGAGFLGAPTDVAAGAGPPPPPAGGEKVPPPPPAVKRRRGRPPGKFGTYKRSTPEERAANRAAKAAKAAAKAAARAGGAPKSDTTPIDSTLPPLPPAAAAVAPVEEAPPPIPLAAPKAVILMHAGMVGYLAGEAEKGYLNKETGEMSATGKLKDVINPRLRLQASCPESIVKGPCKKTDGNLLLLSDAARASLASVTAYNTFLAANVVEGMPTILFSCCPGVENSLEALAGRYQDFKSRESLPYTVNDGKDKKRKEKEAAAAAYIAAEGARASVAGHIFCTPIASAVDKKSGEDKSTLRMAPMLALAEGTRVLIITGSKDAANLTNIKSMMSEMKCASTTQLYVVDGAQHNPFDSTKRTEAEMTKKNTVTERVINTFVDECCQAFAAR